MKYLRYRATAITDVEFFVCEPEPSGIEISMLAKEAIERQMNANSGPAYMLQRVVRLPDIPERSAEG